MQLQSQMKNSLQFRNQLLDGAVQCGSVLYSSMSFRSLDENHPANYSIVIATQNVIFINNKLVDFWLSLVSARFVYVKCHFILTKSINEPPIYLYRAM